MLINISLNRAGEIVKDRLRILRLGVLQYPRVMGVANIQAPPASADEELESASTTGPSNRDSFSPPPRRAPHRSGQSRPPLTARRLSASIGSVELGTGSDRSAEGLTRGPSRACEVQVHESSSRLLFLHLLELLRRRHSRRINRPTQHWIFLLAQSASRAPELHVEAFRRCIRANIDHVFVYILLNRSRVPPRVSLGFFARFPNGRMWNERRMGRQGNLGPRAPHSSPIYVFQMALRIRGPKM
jgi:hypothetical protein